MKKRIGKINTDAIVFSNTDKTAEELLELFLQEKQAFNLSDETISLYRYHCMQFVQSLSSAAKEPGYKVLTLESYKEFILRLRERNIKDKKMSKRAGKIHFSKHRVKYLAKQKNLHQSDIAELIDRSLDTVKGIYREEMILPEHLRLIASKFDASTDYLEGKLNAVATIEQNGEKTYEGSIIPEDRIDDEGYIIPHYSSQLLWEQIPENQSNFLDPFIEAVINSDVVITASGYVNKESLEDIAECMKKEYHWLRQAAIYLVVYCCGANPDTKKYLYNKYKSFWTKSYEILMEKPTIKFKRKTSQPRKIDCLNTTYRQPNILRNIGDSDVSQSIRCRYSY